MNVDYQDIVEATTLQFSMATSERPERAAAAGQQLWTTTSVLGDAPLPAHCLLLVIQSDTEAELEMDKLTQLVDGRSTKPVSRPR